MTNKAMRYRKGRIIDVDQDQVTMHFLSMADPIGGMTITFLRKDVIRDGIADEISLSAHIILKKVYDAGNNQTNSIYN